MQEDPRAMQLRKHSRPRFRGGLAAALALAVLGLAGAPARADRYEPSEAGHPLRVLAYAVHPVGVMLDYLIFRPAHWVGMHEPFKTLFGHTGGLGH